MNIAFSFFLMVGVFLLLHPLGALVLHKLRVERDHCFRVFDSHWFFYSH